MLTFANPQHRAHAGRHEMHRGRLIDCVETPQRLELVADALRALAWPIAAPPQQLLATTQALLPRIHTPAYLAFLQQAWPRWSALHLGQVPHDLLPDVWPTRAMRQDRVPSNFAAQVGYYAGDSGSPITAGTWQAALGGAHCAVAAAQALGRGDSRAAFALTRPPGHHASADGYGGYCFLNNAALAAQHLRDLGWARVAVLDIDYHHGNGTQAIFFARGDVLTLSIHGDPMTEYPFFLGHSDELGQGAGLGANRNWPLPRGTDFGAWRAALEQAIAAVHDWGAQALVVAMGVDTHRDDPISGFLLQTPDFAQIGRMLKTLALPTVFTLEGGYATSAIGENVAQLLAAFDAAA